MKITLLIMVLALSACVSEPRYTYTQSPDSAVLRGFTGKGLFLAARQAEVDIARVDGISVEKILAFDEPRYVAPGKHLLLLKLIHYDINCYATFEMELKAAHRYLFTAIPTSKDFEVVVYDETENVREVVLHALVPRRRKGGIIFLPNKEPNQASAPTAPSDRGSL